jgi:hypothetical protein
VPVSQRFVAQFVAPKQEISDPKKASLNQLVVGSIPPSPPVSDRLQDRARCTLLGVKFNEFVVLVIKVLHLVDEKRGVDVLDDL